MERSRKAGAGRSEVCTRCGHQSSANIIYSVSPRHTDEYYRRTHPSGRCRLKSIALCLERSRRSAHTGTHTDVGADHVCQCQRHSDRAAQPLTTGLGPLCALEAVKLGIKIVNTGVAAARRRLVESVAVQRRAQSPRARLQSRLSTKILLKPVSEHFTLNRQARRVSHRRAGRIRLPPYQHQVPGGMISNLRHQLRKVGHGTQDRRSLGRNHARARRARLPIMVTPLRSSSAARRRSTSSSASATRKSPIRSSNTRSAIGARKAPS